MSGAIQIKTEVGTFVRKEDFDIVAEAYRELEMKYFERGHAMRSSGDTVRSLFMPSINKISAALREPTSSHVKITKIQDALDELNKHTPIGGA